MGSAVGSGNEEGSAKSIVVVLVLVWLLWNVERASIRLATSVINGEAPSLPVEGYHKMSTSFKNRE